MHFFRSSSWIPWARSTDDRVLGAHFAGGHCRLETMPRGNVPFPAELIDGR